MATQNPRNPNAAADLAQPVTTLEPAREVVQACAAGSKCSLRRSIAAGHTRIGA